MSIGIISTEEKKKGSYLLWGDKIFRYVYNDDADDNTMKYGHAVGYAQKISDDKGIVAVDQPATARLCNFAGIVLNPHNPEDSTYNVPAGTWGWICVHGTCIGKVDGTTAITAGMSLKTANSSSKMIKDANAGTKGAYASHAIALENSSADNEYIKVHVMAKI